MAYGSVNVPGKLDAADVNAVPVSRKINNKSLSADISLTASDVGAVPISGGTMGGPLSVQAPTQDAHAATKKYVDSNAGMPMIAKITVKPQSTGGTPKIYNVELDFYTKVNSYRVYKLDFSATLGSGGWYSIELEPPAGYAFITGVESIQTPPYVNLYDRSGTNLSSSVLGILSSDGMISFAVPASQPIGKFEFVYNSTTKFALVAMEVA